MMAQSVVGDHEFRMPAGTQVDRVESFQAGLPLSAGPGDTERLPSEDCHLVLGVN
ncbi:MAG TPA: hypothetical protein VGL10_09620 [Gammaproteobacteria bacterium]